MQFFYLISFGQTCFSLSISPKFISLSQKLQRLISLSLKSSIIKQRNHQAPSLSLKLRPPFLSLIKLHHQPSYFIIKLRVKCDVGLSSSHSVFL
ncbi:hypothetical protein LguiB_000328 [Lonicera macranthoides]